MTYDQLASLQDVRALAGIDLGRPSPPIAGLITAARRHRMEGLIASRVLQCRNELDERDVHELESIQRRKVHEAFAGIVETVSLTAALQANGIETILLKGASVSMRYYEAIGQRSSRDVDLLVRRADAPRAETAIEAAGYVFGDLAGLSFAQRSAYRSLTYDAEFISSDDVSLCELHWALEPQPQMLALDFDELIAHTVHLPLGRLSVRVFDHPLTFIYLCCHGSRHGWFRLKWLADLHRVILKTTNADIDDVLRLVQETGCERPVALGLGLVREIYGTAIPQGLQTILQVNPEITSLQEHCLRRLQMPTTGGPLSIRDIRQQTGEWRYRRKLLAGHPTALTNVVAFGNARDVRTLKLGPRWLWLYNILGPLLSLCRVIRTSLRNSRGEGST